MRPRTVSEQVHKLDSFTKPNINPNPGYNSNPLTEPSAVRANAKNTCFIEADLIKGDETEVGEQSMGMSERGEVHHKSPQNLCLFLFEYQAHLHDRAHALFSAVYRLALETPEGMNIHAHERRQSKHSVDECLHYPKWHIWTPVNQVYWKNQIDINILQSFTM